MSEVKGEHLDTTLDLTRLEFLRKYGPDVKAWKLTDFGLRRVDDNQFPPNLPARAYSTLRLLKRLGIAEEDELADYSYCTLKSTRTLLARLAGYGYVELIGATTEEGGK